jgi:hypothetical protein
MITLPGDLDRHIQLTLYTSQEVVKCLDVLHQRKLNGRTLDNYTSHLLFIGDSRIRQLFFNFLKVKHKQFYNEKGKIFNVVFLLYLHVVYFSWFRSTTDDWKLVKSTISSMSRNTVNYWIYVYLTFGIILSEMISISAFQSGWIFIQFVITSLINVKTSHCLSSFFLVIIG